MNEVIRAGLRVLARSDAWVVTSRVTHADCESVRLAGASPSNHGTSRTLLTPFDCIVPATRAAGVRVVRRKAWARHALSTIAASRPFGNLAAAARARIDLLPFQIEPALAMLRYGCTRMLIADEVGLGKTVQAGLILNELSQADDGFRAIVLVPAGLREQWRGELQDRFLLTPINADAAWLAASGRELPPDLNPWSLPGTYIASLDLVKRPEVLRALEEVTWDAAVIDEAHGCGLGTARIAAAHAVGIRARRVLLLTATPPDGDPQQLAAMCAIGAIDAGPIVEFRRTRADLPAAHKEPPYVDAPRRSVLMSVRLSASERRMHRLLERYTTLVWHEATARLDTRARLAATVLRKRALSSAWSLRASVARRLALLGTTVPDSEPQLLLPFGDEDPLDDEVADSVMGAAGLGDARRERALLRRIEQAAADAMRHESKLRFLLRFLRRAREPVIVFTEYRDTLAHLEHEVRAAGQAPLLLHGGLLPRARADVQRAFNGGGSLLLATDAASEGLNLHTRCRTVVHFELPWTPARLEQRTGRVDRLGQHRRAHELLLVARHTAERMVLAPLVRRSRIAHSLGNAARTLAMLNESHIAAAIMASAPLEIAMADVPPVKTFDLREQASHEAFRIAQERRVTIACPGDGAAPGILVCRARRCRSNSVLLLFRVTLEDNFGRVVHATCVPLLIRLRYREWSRTAAALRLLATELQSSRFSGLEEVVDAVARPALGLARQQHAAVVDALRGRDAAMLRSLPSAARALVQVGLFDNRAVRLLERQRRTAALLADDVADRHPPSERLEQRITLNAVLCGFRLQAEAPCDR